MGGGARAAWNDGLCEDIYLMGISLRTGNTYTGRSRDKVEDESRV